MDNKNSNELIVVKENLLDKIKNFFRKLFSKQQQDKIEEVEPMTHTLDDFEYSLREDIVEESVPIEDLLSNCDVHSAREVEVPKVVG